MPQEITLKILHAIRDTVGSDVKGVGPELRSLLQHRLLVEQNPDEILFGIQEAERFELVRVDRGIPVGPRPGIPSKPAELQSIVSVNILEAGQVYLD
ncbi:hypothetical protein [uncultured Ruegeria sp.]|uniref:hypothetical protein n=1 Tax=uncultured Ruegeria sp. TaxID=259304 RepID=UPI00262A4D16|nr:hypothetical protein [uncultured Ruegeria sp.]